MHNIQIYDIISVICIKWAWEMNGDRALKWRCKMEIRTPEKISLLLADRHINKGINELNVSPSQLFQLELELAPPHARHVGFCKIPIPRGTNDFS